MYDFVELLRTLYRVEDLKKLHLGLPEGYQVPEGIDGLGNDTDSRYHTIFYDKIREGWEDFILLYKSFIYNEVLTRLNDNITIYQSLPSYRIQYPFSKAVTTKHCDSDKNHKHPVGEINILVPLTDMYGTSAVWAETSPGKGDFTALEGSYGDFYIWNGNKCNHYNKINTTSATRVSLDFRVLPDKFYNPDAAQHSATSGKKFIIGDYYSKFVGV